MTKDYSDLNPAILKPGLVTADGDLKPGLVTGNYAGGIPSAANQVRPSLLNTDGTLRRSLLTAAGELRPSLLSGAAVVLPQFRRPGGVDQYFRPDAASLYLRA